MSTTKFLKKHDIEIECVSAPVSLPLGYMKYRLVHRWYGRGRFSVDPTRHKSVLTVTLYGWHCTVPEALLELAREIRKKETRAELSLRRKVYMWLGGMESFGDLMRCKK